MLCSRCMRSALSSPPSPSRLTTHTLRAAPKISSPASQSQYGRRSLAILSSTSSLRRPTAFTPSARLVSPIESPLSSSITPIALDSLPATQSSILQTRGAKRDTFRPSHVVRKRRHGFLSRIRTRLGRKLLLRRIKKKRSTLSH